MKKYLIFIFVLIFASANIPCLALAADVPKLEVITPTSAQPGDEISVDIVIRDNPGVMVMVLGIDYDSACLEYIGYEDGIFTGWEVFTNAVWIGDSNLDSDGTILTLKFKVIDNASPCSTKIAVTYEEGDIANYDEEIIMPEIVPGGVEIFAGGTSNDSAPPDKPDEDVEETYTENDSVEAESEDSSDEPTDVEETEDIETHPATEPVENGFKMRLTAIIIAGVVIAIAMVAAIIRKRRV